MNARYFTIAICSLICAARASAQADQRTLTVSNSTNSCGGAQFTKIQDAIDIAAPGDKIKVCSGVYPEQVNITKSLTLNLDRDAVLLPVSVAPNGISLSSSAPFAAVILVTNSSGVSIDGGLVDGSKSGITGCAPRLFGIVFQNSSGSITNTKIRDVHLVEQLNGCQSGTAIFVQSGNGGTSNVVIEKNTLIGYQKNGITANEPGTVVFIRHNHAYGIGPTTGAAQNGIQVGFGATGEISGNTVVDHQWQPCVSISNCQFFAAGILVAQSGGVQVGNNFADGNQVHIVLDGNSNVADHNHLSNAVALDAMQILGEQCQALKNLIAGADNSGVFVAGNQADIENNKFMEVPIGILKANTVQGLVQTDNVFIKVGEDFIDPVPNNSPQPSPELL